MVANPAAGRGSKTDSISRLRQRLLRARIDHDLAMLVQVEEELRQLATAGYRCCLVDYEDCRPTFYVRVIGYEKARVKVELEYPIEPRLDNVQWLPLSHLADYDEAENSQRLQDVYSGLAPFIHNKSMQLQKPAGDRGFQLLPSANGSADGQAGTIGSVVRRPQRSSSRPRRWVLVSGVLLLMSLSWFAGMQMGRLL
jgi:hypothetical protein